MTSGLVAISRTCVDPFALPIVNSNRLAELGERAETFRKQRLEAHHSLIMTGLHTALERVPELDASVSQPLSPAQREIRCRADRHPQGNCTTRTRGLRRVRLERLVGKLGSTTPCPHISAGRTRRRRSSCEASRTGGASARERSVFNRLLLGHRSRGQRHSRASPYPSSDT